MEARRIALAGSVLAALTIAAQSSAAPFSASPTVAASGVRGSDERRSLEDLLEAAKARQAEAQAQLAAPLDAALAEFTASERTPTPAEVSSILDRLIALGPEAAPLLARRLDVPEGATKNEKLRASQVAVALSRMDTGAITRDLLALLDSASDDGKRNALRALQTTPDPDRVRPAIVALFRRSDSSVKQSCLRTMIVLGGPEGDALMNEVLSGPDENLVALAITGLADNQVAAAVDQVRGILMQPQPAARHVASLLRYFLAMPSLATANDVQAFVRIASASSVAVDDRVAVLDALPALRPAVNAEFKRSLEPILGAADNKLREAGLVMMTRLGDKSSRKELLRSYDEMVEKNENWYDAYVRRADVYARIGDDDDAIKDYKQALSVGRNDPSLQKDLWVKLARAYTRRGKFKDAADTLRKGPIPLADLQALADDPEFRPLRDSKYGKDAFALK